MSGKPRLREVKFQKVPELVKGSAVLNCVPDSKLYQLHGERSVCSIDLWVGFVDNVLLLSQLWGENPREEGGRARGKEVGSLGPEQRKKRRLLGRGVVSRRKPCVLMYSSNLWSQRGS